MVEMVYKTEDDKFFSTFEEAEKWEENVEKFKKEEQILLSLFEQESFHMAELDAKVLDKHCFLTVLRKYFLEIKPNEQFY